jgi:hypothetical protein
VAGPTCVQSFLVRMPLKDWPSGSKRFPI